MKRTFAWFKSTTGTFCEWVWLPMSALTLLTQVKTFNCEPNLSYNSQVVVTCKPLQHKRTMFGE